MTGDKKEDKKRDGINNAAFRYANNSEDSGKKLIEYFEPVLKNLANLLYHGGAPSGKVSSNLYDLLGGSQTLNVINDVLSPLTYEDVLQEMRILFLEFACDFKPEEINDSVADKFSYYVVRRFHLFVKQKYIENLTSQPISENSFDIEQFSNKECNHEQPNSFVLEECFFNELVLDEKWVEGETCSDIFSELNKTERKILKKYYADDVGINELADEFDLHKRSMFKNLNKIKNKIKHIKTYEEI